MSLLELEPCGENNCKDNVLVVRHFVALWSNACFVEKKYEIPKNARILSSYKASEFIARDFYIPSKVRYGWHWLIDKKTGKEYNVPYPENMRCPGADQPLSIGRVIEIQTKEN